MLLKMTIQQRFLTSVGTQDTFYQTIAANYSSVMGQTVTMDYIAESRMNTMYPMVVTSDYQPQGLLSEKKIHTVEYDQRESQATIANIALKFNEANVFDSFNMQAVTKKATKCQAKTVGNISNDVAVVTILGRFW